MDQKKPETPQKPDQPGFVAQFKHWRSGKIIRAADYGYRGFPIGRRKK